MIGKGFIPDGFDFEGTELHGWDYSKPYHFDRVLGVGAQAMALKFTRDNGESVVFKYFPRDTGGTSTQFHRNDKSNYLAQLNEFDYLKYLSAYARIGAFYKKMHDQIEMVGEDIVLEGERMTPVSFLKYAASYHDIEDIKGYETRTFPLIVDYVTRLYDKKNDIHYFPIADNSVIHNDSPFFDSMSTYVPVCCHEEGKTLDGLLRSGNVDNPIELVGEIIRSVAMLHYVGVLSRDIKPENILITDKGKAVHLDFGISQFTSPSDRVALAADRLYDDNVNTHCSTLERFISREWFGGRLFSSPENLKCVVHRKGDIFSTGLVCAYILAREHPFLPEEGDFYREGRDILELKRKYAEIVKDDELMQERYISFLSRNDSDVMRMIAPMFNPDPRQRPNRMILMGVHFPIPLPNLPPYYDPREEDCLEGINRTRAMSEFLDSLPKDMRVVYFGNYSDNFIVNITMPSLTEMFLGRKLED